MEFSAANLLAEQHGSLRCELNVWRLLTEENFKGVYK
jgi:hypothetical protein